MTDDQNVTQADVEAFCEEASVDAKWILDGGGTSGVRNMVWAGARIIARHRTAHSGEGPCPMCLGVRIVAGEVCERCRGVGYLNLRSGDLAPGLERAAHSGEGRSNGAGEDAVGRAVEAMTAWTSGEADIQGRVWVIEKGKRVASFAESDEAYEDAKRRNVVAVIAALSAPQGEVERLRETLERIAKLTPASANAHTAQDLCLTVRAIAESALAQSEGAKSE